MLQYGNAQLWTSGGKLMILDPHLYATTQNPFYTLGTLNDHSLGLVYYHLLMQTLSAEWFTE